MLEAARARVVTGYSVVYTARAGTPAVSLGSTRVRTAKRILPWAVRSSAAIERARTAGRRASEDMVLLVALGVGVVAAFTPPYAVLECVLPFQASCRSTHSLCVSRLIGGPRRDRRPRPRARRPAAGPTCADRRCWRHASRARGTRTLVRTAGTPAASVSALRVPRSLAVRSSAAIERARTAGRRACEDMVLLVALGVGVAMAFTPPYAVLECVLPFQASSRSHSLYCVSHLIDGRSLP